VVASVQDQLGIHDRGTVALSIDGYWDGVIDWVKTATKAGFVKADNDNILVSAKTAEEAVIALENYKISEARYQLDWSSA